ncbi:MAG: GNAT family N-acetyltransferase [Candidatus Rokuibacteriota bacterium]
MRELRTDRLRLVPLDAEGMRLFVADWPALQRRLGLTPSPAWMSDGATLDAARRHRDAMLRDPGDSMWWTFWQVVLASGAASVGLVDFKGPPGPEGGVTVGCALAPAYRGRGYATEAVGALVAHALRQPAVRRVAAETDGANVPAHRLLKRLGFTPGARVRAGMARHGETGKLVVWRLAKPAAPVRGRQGQAPRVV